MGFPLQIALASALIPLLVGRGLDRLTYFLMMIVMMAGMFGGIFFKSHISAPVSGAISLLIPIVSFIVTKLVLERSSTAYRPRTNLFSGWQMGVGR
jgi:SNF family Na+-dependent transporter